MFVREYTALGVSLGHIRETAEALASVVGPFPFSSSELLVNGRKLIVKTAEGVLQRPDVGQIVADYAVSLCKRVEIRDRFAAVYVPEGFDNRIRLDKQIHGGEASITEYAIPTRSIYSLWEAERALTPVAAYFDIREEDVTTAVRYEGEWRLAA